MKNRYLKVANFSAAKFRLLSKCYALDLPATTAAHFCALNRNTAQRVYTLLRERVIILALMELRPFAGEIEVDESYFGPQRVRGKRGRGAAGKTPVLGLHKRGEQVFVSVVKNCSKQALLPVLRGHILRASDVYTDGWKAYDGLVDKGYKHHRVFHHANEFARGKNHVNGIESFWSFAKFRLNKLRGIRKQKFFMHLKECEWRWNHRGENLIRLLLKSCRLTPLNSPLR
jgi:transposase-like protein